MRVEDLLSESAARAPEHTAVVCPRGRWSYGQIDAASDRFARVLHDAGAEHGDRVLICLDNSIDTIVALFGALKAGCIFIIVNPHARPEHVCGLLTDSGARVLVARSPQIQALEPSWPRLLQLQTIIHAENELNASIEGSSFRAPRFDEPRSDTDVAALVYTSGSTGEPKGVMLTHRNLTAAAESICTYLGNTADDVILNALPLAFTYGLGQITTAFRAGATVILERSFAYPRAIVDTIEREHVTGLPLVPTMATLLLRHDLSQHGCPTLRYITNAAAALTATKLRQLRETFPAAAFYSMYGQTECQRASYLPPEHLDARSDSVGIAIPGTSCRVIDERGTPASAGAVGELVVRGAHVMAGYWNRPDATQRALHLSSTPGDMELRTGDLFRTDEDGFLYFVERMDDIIKSGGEKVAPRRVEQVIAELPDVADVSVFGVPDDVLGEIVVAVVTPADGAALTREHVQRHCAKRLDSHQIPKIVTVRDCLPTTLTGKVSRRALRQTAIAEGWSA
jgi:long-chain acyl-CoA synthetase